MMEEFKANEILKELDDLYDHVKRLGEIQNRFLDSLERYYERIESEKEGEIENEEYKRIFNK